MSDTHKMVIPENVELDYEIAGIGTRFLAIAIDTIIQLIVSGVITSAIFSLGLEKLIATRGRNTPHLAWGVISVLLIMILFIIGFGYHIILENVMNGQTLGKKLVNIRIRKDDGSARTFGIFYYEILSV